MEYLELTHKFHSGKITLMDYITVCDGKDLLSGIKEAKAKFDSEHFVPDEKRAILIGNKTYKSSPLNLPNLDSVSTDLKKMEAFLTEQANFDDANVERLIDKDENALKHTFEELRKWAKSMTHDLETNEEKKPSEMKKGLLFIYYSGHGMIADGVTSIVTPNGSFFPLPVLVHCANGKSRHGIGLSVYPNVMVVVFMDCCRVFPKGAHDPEPVSGQYYIYFAVEVGTPAASGSKSAGTMSVFTKELLDLFGKALTETKKVEIPSALRSLKFSEKGATMSCDIAYKKKKEEETDD